ncbi:hypothetical protein PHIN3_378 [Sinorhizobium phage phiN3]|uniref:Uncharacterized protein n=1 Tax=Sinorhizobium phage phiN3 TaxID=1647405 RepID=A0A0F6YPJ8_9CAUD|nr:hypothetical protein AVT40_gp155 [Sinorhizobium phage phiN3]AKF13641.1 hypothetical protein PHIN3_378 [Sinorhizobium phage phiN3]
MRNSLKTALAYAHITGNLPKNIHMDTYLQASSCLKTGFGNGPPRKIVKDEYLKDIEDHPFVIGHKLLSEQGFSLPRQRKTSHTISYMRHDDVEAFITRSGKHCWYWTPNGRGGMATETFDLK